MNSRQRRDQIDPAGNFVSGSADLLSKVLTGDWLPLLTIDDHEAPTRNLPLPPDRMSPSAGGETA